MKQDELETKLVSATMGDKLSWQQTEDGTYEAHIDWYRIIFTEGSNLFVEYRGDPFNDRKMYEYEKCTLLNKEHIIHSIETQKEKTLRQLWEGIERREQALTRLQSRKQDEDVKEDAAPPKRTFLQKITGRGKTC